MFGEIVFARSDDGGQIWSLGIQELGYFPCSGSPDYGNGGRAGKWGTIAALALPFTPKLGALVNFTVDAKGFVTGVTWGGEMIARPSTGLQT